MMVFSSGVNWRLSVIAMVRERMHNGCVLQERGFFGSVLPAYQMQVELRLVTLNASLFSCGHIQTKFGFAQTLRKSNVKGKSPFGIFGGGVNLPCWWPCRKNLASRRDSAS